MNSYHINRKPGRPKAIPKGTIPKVIDLYKRGFGYRAIKRELDREGLSVHWSTVRNLVKQELGNIPVRRLSKCYYGTPADSVISLPRVVYVQTPAKQINNGLCHSKPSERSICRLNNQKVKSCNPVKTSTTS